MSFNVFHRTWWRFNSDWPDELEPCVGRKHYIQKKIWSEDEARSIAQEWNSKHNEGRLSDKAEYEEV